MVALKPLGKKDYEVWVSETKESPYLLIVMRTKSGKGFKILDPQKRKKVFSSGDFVEIIDYLREDEFIPVEGRMKLPGSKREDSGKPTPETQAT